MDHCNVDLPCCCFQLSSISCSKISKCFKLFKEKKRKNKYNEKQSSQIEASSYIVLKASKVRELTKCFQLEWLTKQWWKPKKCEYQ